MSSATIIHGESLIQLPSELARALILTEKNLGADPALRTARWQTGAAQTSSIAEAAFFRAEASVTVLGIRYVPSAASAPASGSNSIVIAVSVRDGAGGASASVASATVDNTHQMSAFQSFSLGTLTNTVLAAGNVLTLATTVTGTATLPIGFLSVVYRVN